MRARLVGLVVAAAASSAADAPRLVPAPAIDPAPLAGQYAADLLWPLTRAPDGGPHVDLLAWYDVAADEVCGAKPARTPPAHVAAYVTAWCVPDGQRAAALARLLDGESPAVQTAIRADIVDALAEVDDGSDAHAWLVAHRLDGHDMLDALAAADIAMGKPATWYEWRDNRAPPAMACRRAGLAVRDGNLPDANVMAVLRDQTFDLCTRVAIAVDCPLVNGDARVSWPSERALGASIVGDLSACGSIASVDHVDKRTLAGFYAARLVARWPSSDADAVRWLAYARVAVGHSDWGADLEDIAAAALTNAVVTGSCAPAVLAEAGELAHELHAKPDRIASGARDARLATIASRDRCR